MLRFSFLLLGVALALLTVSCDKNTPAPASPAPQAAPAKTNLQIFQVKGLVKELDPDGKTVSIRHEEIPGYMAAMTMPLEVRDTNELRGVQAGHTVSFRMLVTDKEGWIDQIKILDVPKTNPPALPQNMRIVRDVEPLNIGDALPEYHFTNQLNEAVSLSQFKGKALAITFIFTRCPYPEFCPLMEDNFRAVQDKLLQTAFAPTNWQLLTITFDPEYDTPERLANYAQSRGARAAHWSHLTGALIDITALSEQVGLMFTREPDNPASINHTLRTVVVDARGRVQKIIPKNKWTPDELADELVKAAQAKD